MPTKKRASPGTGKKTKSPQADDVQSALAALKRMSTPRDRANLTRFGITTDKFFGVSMANMQVLAKRLGRNHDLAAALWESGWYEARMLATLIDEQERVTAAQMDRWCRDFDNWAICDTACFKLFDQTPHAWRKVAQWCKREDEFVKRAGFALLACLAVHDKATGDAPFLKSLRLVEQGATDERNFVKKGVSWALRGIGRRSPALNTAAVKLARRLSATSESAPRWVGKDALGELTSPAVTKLLAAKRRTAKR
jgi:3-methyladenine DNA glycosylase AlkD